MKPIHRFLAALAASMLAAASMAATAAPPRQKPAGAPARTAAPEASRSADSAAPLESAIADLANGELDSALAAARRAVASSPANYKAHYYVAFILFKQNQLEQAQAAVQEALHFAPDEARAELRKLSQAIKSTRTTSQAATLAEAAQAEGLNGKAAALWKQAWEAGYANPEHGFAAAQAYAGTLAQPIAAAQILREIIAKSTDPDAADKATRLLDQLAPKLSTIASTQFLAAQRASGPGRMQLLRDVLDADPNFVPAYELRASAAAQAGDLSALKETLRDLSRRNKLDLGMLKRAEYAALVKDPGMLSWLDDLVGTVAAQKLLAEIAEQDGQRNAEVGLARDQQSYQKELHAYSEKMALHRKYLPCLEDVQARHRQCEKGLPKRYRGVFGIGGNGATYNAMSAACERQTRERVAQCSADYPADPPAEPVAPSPPAA